MVLNMNRSLRSAKRATAIATVRTDFTFRTRISKATHEMIVVGTSNVPGKSRRQPVYRVWSGSHDWDATVQKMN